MRETEMRQVIAPDLLGHGKMAVKRITQWYGGCMVMISEDVLHLGGADANGIIRR
jgi:hypothetical protein